jgi:hypothetical protein
MKPDSYSYSATDNMLRGLKPASASNKSFDPQRQFDTIKEACGAIAALPPCNRLSALADVVAYNIKVRELGFACDLLSAFAYGDHYDTLCD